MPLFPSVIETSLIETEPATGTGFCKSPKFTVPSANWTCSMLLMTSVPSADPARVSTSRADVVDNTVTVYCERRPLRTNVSSPPAPSTVSLPPPPRTRFATSLPVIVSANALPMAFSITAPNAMEKLLSAPSEEKAPSCRSMVTACCLPLPSIVSVPPASQIDWMIPLGPV